jgi:hypothetical protein
MDLTIRRIWFCELITPPLTRWLRALEGQRSRQLYLFLTRLVCDDNLPESRDTSATPREAEPHTAISCNSKGYELCTLYALRTETWQASCCFNKEKFRVRSEDVRPIVEAW